MATPQLRARHRFRRSSALDLPLAPWLGANVSPLAPELGPKRLILGAKAWRQRRLSFRSRGAGTNLEIGHTSACAWSTESSSSQHALDRLGPPLHHRVLIDSHACLIDSVLLLPSSCFRTCSPSSRLMLDGPACLPHSSCLMGILSRRAPLNGLTHRPLQSRRCLATSTVLAHAFLSCPPPSLLP